MNTPRPRLVGEIEARLRDYPVVALIGMRQSGKTTLAREIAGRRRGPTHVFDLEDDRDLARLREPIAALESLRGLIVLDEIQHLPDAFAACASSPIAHERRADSWCSAARLATCSARARRA